MFLVCQPSTRYYRVMPRADMHENAIKSAYDYLVGDDGLKKSNKDVRLVFMKQCFLLRLHERRRAREDDFQRREALLAEAVIRRLDTDSLNPEGYVVLSERDADNIADKVLTEDPQYTVVDSERLAAGDHS